MTSIAKASSNSSSSSVAVEGADSLDDSSSASGSEPEVLDLFEDLASSEDEGCDRFADLVTAKPDHSYRGHSVHFWTLPYSSRPDRVTAETHSAKGVMRLFKQVYGEALEYYAVFKEYHAASSKDWERKPHFHICLKLHRRVKLIRISQALRRHSIYAHLSVPTRFLCFWRVIAYCYVPIAAGSLCRNWTLTLSSVRSFPLTSWRRSVKASPNHSCVHGTFTKSSARFRPSRLMLIASIGHKSSSTRVHRNTWSSWPAKARRWDHCSHPGDS